MNHSHVLYDSDPHFKIDPISRNIINESTKKVRLIQHDHNSERFTFELPQHIEGHDMSSCNLVEIHYVNVGANTQVVRGGVYTVDDLHVNSDNSNTVVFSWLIPNQATQYVGQLNFLVRFSCVNEGTGRVEYVWNTGIHSGITVSSGIYNSDTQSDNPVYPYNFVTTLNGSVLTFYVGSEEEYKQLEESGLTIENCLYIIDDNTTDTPEDTDDNTTDIPEDINEKLKELDTKIENFKLGESIAKYSRFLKPENPITLQVTNGNSEKIELELGSLYIVIYWDEGSGYTEDNTYHYTGLLYYGSKDGDSYGAVGGDMSFSYRGLLQKFQFFRNSLGANGKCKIIKVM